MPFRHQNLNIYEDERHIRRLAELMRSYVERADERFKENMKYKELVNTASMDERIAFEKGYIMGDIIETYRKALVFTEKQMKKQSYLESDRLRYLQYVQHAYIKVYHLVHMMHEINPKFGADNTGQSIKLNLGFGLQKNSPTYYGTAGFNYAKELEEIREKLVKERQEKVHKERGIRDREMIMNGVASPPVVKKTTNWWPIAYGWDIDYYW